MSIWPRPKPPAVLPPRPPGLPFATGVVAWVPLPPEEVAHYAAWKPVMRVPVQSGELAQTALETFPAGWPIVLLVETLNDGLVNEIADRLAVAGRTDVYVELGNELNGVESPAQMNAFYRHSLTRLDGIVALDHIITCGVANIEPKTIQWVKDSIVGLPLAVLCGFHCYSNWEQNRTAFVSMLGGRLCAMTEWGSFNLVPEAPAADKIAVDLASIYQMPCTMAVWYQNHCASPNSEPNWNFGLCDQFSNTWRLQAEAALQAARR